MTSSLFPFSKIPALLEFFSEEQLRRLDGALPRTPNYGGDGGLTCWHSYLLGHNTVGKDIHMKAMCSSCKHRLMQAFSPRNDRVCTRVDFKPREAQ